MEITPELRHALVQAKRDLLRRPHPDVVSVGIGLKEKNGIRSETPVIVFGVREKLQRAEVLPERMLPTQVVGQQTDVIERGDIVALDIDPVSPQALIQRRRPCPPGFSIGHVTISAGTLGAWVHTDDENYKILSNNHVLAASNAATLGDWIIQPGKADGGFSGNDKIAQLETFVHINFEEKNKNKSASAYWRAWKWAPNRMAKATGCPYRLSVHTESQGVPQPNPNLVDAAIARPIHQEMVSHDAPFIGPFSGLGAAQLGDQVQKVGRTTEHTTGQVVGVETAVRVGYGPAGVAVFDDQMEIASNEGEFSAGGDSGSVILSDDNMIVGLLFAGGAGITIANRIGNVIALLGVRF